MRQTEEGEERRRKRKEKDFCFFPLFASSSILVRGPAWVGGGQCCVFGFVKRLGVDRGTVLLYKPNLSETTESTVRRERFTLARGLSGGTLLCAVADCPAWGWMKDVKTLDLPHGKNASSPTAERQCGGSVNGHSDGLTWGQSETNRSRQKAATGVYEEERRIWTWGLVRVTSDRGK